jgi:hypothetical protein
MAEVMTGGRAGDEGAAPSRWRDGPLGRHSQRRDTTCDEERR